MHEIISYIHDSNINWDEDFILLFTDVILYISKLLFPCVMIKRSNLALYKHFCQVFSWYVDHNAVYEDIHLDL